MISICLLFFKSSSPIINLLGIVPSAQITIGITVTFMLHCFFLFFYLNQDLYFYLSFRFLLILLYVAETAKSSIWQAFFFLLLIITRSSRLPEIKWSVRIW